MKEGSDRGEQKERALVKTGIREIGRFTHLSGSVSPSLFLSLSRSLSFWSFVHNSVSKSRRLASANHRPAKSVEKRKALSLLSDEPIAHVSRELPFGRFCFSFRLLSPRAPRIISY